MNTSLTPEMIKQLEARESARANLDMDAVTFVFTVIDQIKSLKRQPAEVPFLPGYFPRVPVGMYFLSIQASQYHYCEPRSDAYETLGCYQLVELAVLDAEGDIDYRWTGADVAGYISWEEVEAIVLRVQQDNPEFPHGDKSKVFSCTAEDSDD